MSKRILVVYGSQHGATAEIATRIGEVLRAAGLEAEVVDAREAPAPAGYDAVVLGSAVYIGSWRKEAACYLTTNEAALTKLPVWIFSSGPTGEGDPVELAAGWTLPKKLKPVAERIAVRDVAIFAGVADLATLSRLEKWMLRNVKAPLGDFRDWAAIEAWAQEIAASLG